MGKEERLGDEDLSTLDRSNRNEVKRLQKSLRSATSKGDLTEQSKLYNAIGVILHEAELLPLALRYFTQDLEVSEKLGRRYEIAVAHRKVGEVFAELGEFEPAICHQEKQLSLVEELGDVLEQQRAYATLGRTYATWVEIDRDNLDLKELITTSASHYMKALELVKQLRTKKLSTEKDCNEMRYKVYLNIGLLYVAVDEKLSNSFLQKAIKGAKENRDTNIQFLALRQLVESSLLKGDVAQALSYAQSSVKITESSDCSSEISQSNEMLALAHLHSNNVLLARKCAKRAIQINSDLDKAMSIYKVTKLIMSTQQIDFGEGEREVVILSKISDILIELSLFIPAIHYLKQELLLAKQSAPQLISGAHEKLGDCYKETHNSKLALYHYTQQLSLSPSAITWTNVALLSQTDDQPFQECHDAVQAGMCEAKSPGDQITCLETLVKIAKHYGKEDISSSAQQELEKIESSLPDSCTQSQETQPISDVEISESENEEVGDETESKSVRCKRPNALGRVNENGETPLHQACVRGKTDKVRELLGKHATPNTRDYAGWTPLHEACNHGYIEIVQLLVGAGADLNDRGGRECNGWTPLHDAAQWGNLAIARYLVENGAHTLARDDEGRTALQLVTSLLEDTTEDANTDSRRAVVKYLTAIAANPPPVKPHKPPTQPKRLDSEELFTTGAGTSFSSTQVTGSSTQLSRTAGKENTSDNYQRSRSRVSDSAVYKRHASKLSRTHKRSSEPPQSSKKSVPRSRQSGIDDWLIDDSSSSPKRKFPSDPFQSNQKKRPKQTKLSVVIKDEDSPDFTEIPVAKPLSTPGVVPLTQADVPILRVNIKIRDKLFRLQVKVGQTVADLGREAAQRYRSKLGILPKLSLTTAEGAELDEAAIACQLLLEGDDLVGAIEEVEHAGLLEKYLETCQRLDLPPSLRSHFASSVSSLGLRRALVGARQQECFFTTILCATSLNKLDISFNKLSKEVMTTFYSVLPTLASLKDLNVAGCGISNTSFFRLSEALSKLPLQTINLDYSGISSCFIPLLELISSVSSLTSVSAKCCTLSSTTPPSPELSDKLARSGVTSLDISQNFISRFPTLPQNLKTLILGGASIENSGLVLPTSIESLTLENCTLNDSNFREILSDMRLVTSFRAPFNHITGEGVVDLVMLFPRLSLLDLSSNPLGADGVETLSLVTPPTVTLQNCRAGGVGADVLSGLHASVGSCDLSYNGIDYTGFCRELAEEVREGVTCQGKKLVIKGALEGNNS